MDWKGLLNWSLKYNDGTVAKPDIKPMSLEDQKFIEAAFESVTINEMKEVMKILDILQNIPEQQDEEFVNNRLDQLDDLLNLLDGLENPRNIVRSKRFHEIISYFFKTQNLKIKTMMARILTSMMQNDTMVQDAAIDCGIYKFLKLIHEGLVADTEPSKDKIELNNKYIYLLTGLLYGNNTASKKLFLEEFEGMKLLYNLLITNNSSSSPNYNYNTFKRILSIIRELTKIDLDFSENQKIHIIALEKAKEINLKELLGNVLNSNECKTEDDIDIAFLILDIFANIIKSLESLDEGFAVIEKVNKKVSTLGNFSEENKLHLVEVIKIMKEEFNRTDSQVAIFQENTIEKT